VHVLHVVGARPNFMQVAPVLRALDQGQGGRRRWFIPASTTTPTCRMFSSSSSEFRRRR